MHDIGDADDEAVGGLVPLYILVNGRTSPRNTALDLATQVIAMPNESMRLEPEYADILRLCHRRWMSVAEIGAYLHRPLTITKVMVDVLLEQGLLVIGSPAQQTVADRKLLETVLAGLERL
ncbi:DUF742 domain-containing protein [Micromonospora sp. NPDC049799]|uniref:DUF742 domain-containing protein n=1 Tax=Micromonospora sp. NPDC049799 TaxID=3154741 RepID=UPI0033EC5486